MVARQEKAGSAFCTEDISDRHYRGDALQGPRFAEEMLCQGVQTKLDRVNLKERKKRAACHTAEEQQAYPEVMCHTVPG